ncbi:hypothetical protein SDC9_200862 [bioreactor metagenome]|uniref:Uncharacterized protein n=1 Tax=bioreactor metagenome TaxID=1076179 RepID=A0A645IPD3_9ZZZZ
MPAYHEINGIVIIPAGIDALRVIAIEKKGRGFGFGQRNPAGGVNGGVDGFGDCVFVHIAPKQSERPRVFAVQKVVVRFFPGEKRGKFRLLRIRNPMSAWEIQGRRFIEGFFTVSRKICCCILLNGLGRSVNRVEFLERRFFLPPGKPLMQIALQNSAGHGPIFHIDKYINGHSIHISRDQ